MALIKIRVRHSGENYQGETTFFNDDCFVNTNNINYIYIFGDIARICFGTEDYVETPVSQLEKLKAIYDR